VEEGGRNEARALRPDPFSTYFVILSHVVDLLAAERERERTTTHQLEILVAFVMARFAFFPLFLIGRRRSIWSVSPPPPILSAQSVGWWGGIARHVGTNSPAD
jgi:hypothetical protein